MPVEIRDQGQYELFETTHGHRILVLKGEHWFAWIEGQESPILVHSDSDHQRERTVRDGEFLVVDFHEDPEFKDMPHLFLQDGESFREYMIPNGLPTEQDHQKRVVTDETLPREEWLVHPCTDRPLMDAPLRCPACHHEWQCPA